MSDSSNSNQGINELEVKALDGAGTEVEGGASKSTNNAPVDFMSHLESNSANIRSTINTGGQPNRRKGVSLFAGWQFVRFREGDNESYPVMPRTDFNAPVLEYCPTSCGLDQLENPNFVPFWLPMALLHFCKDLLAHELISEENRSEEERKKFCGQGWDMFREELTRQTGDTMAELCRMARLSGFHETADYMTQCLYYESGLSDAIDMRQQGRAVLRSA